MGCNCGGKRAGMKYRIQNEDGTYDPKLRDTLAQAQAAVSERTGASYRALRPTEVAALLTRQGASA
jgi:hypothetical protein